MQSDNACDWPWPDIRAYAKGKFHGTPRTKANLCDQINGELKRKQSLPTKRSSPKRRPQKTSLPLKISPIAAKSNVSSSACNWPWKDIQKAAQSIKTSPRTKANLCRLLDEQMQVKSTMQSVTPLDLHFDLAMVPTYLKTVNAIFDSF